VTRQVCVRGAEPIVIEVVVSCLIGPDPPLRLTVGGVSARPSAANAVIERTGLRFCAAAFGSGRAARMKLLIGVSVRGWPFRSLTTTRATAAPARPVISALVLFQP